MPCMPPLRSNMRLHAQADIQKVRDPSVQTEHMGVPESHLGGHAFHTYRSACGLPSSCKQSGTCMMGDA